MDYQAIAQDKIFCSRCSRTRATDEFEINKQGKRNKTCKRHSKKRPLEVDDWENFILVLRNWNKPVSNSKTKSKKVEFI
jgi:hypothetical protein